MTSFNEKFHMRKSYGSIKHKTRNNFVKKGIFNKRDNQSHNNENSKNIKNKNVSKNSYNRNMNQNNSMNQSENKYFKESSQMKRYSPFNEHYRVNLGYGDEFMSEPTYLACRYRRCGCPTSFAAPAPIGVTGLFGCNTCTTSRSDPFGVTGCAGDCNCVAGCGCGGPAGFESSIDWERYGKKKRGPQLK